MRDESGFWDCVYIHDDAAELTGCVQVDALGVPVFTPELVAALNAEALNREAEARKIFEQFVKTHDVITGSSPRSERLAASWREISADIAETVSRCARYTDAVVLKRAPKYLEPTFATIGSIVIASGRPVLLFPEDWRPRPIRRVAIAWKDTCEAARAVNAAMPVMAQASQCFLFSATEGSKLEHSEKSIHACAAFLRWHGLDPEIRYMESDEEDAKPLIFAEAAGVGADLLVMGAYGHSRMREFVFGGFTRHALSESAIPLMLVH